MNPETQPPTHSGPSGAPLVAVCMGSTSDLPTMQAATGLLAEFGVAHETRILSAHRTPQAMVDFGNEAAERGLEVIIAGAGGAAHLPGMLASLTLVPVVGVPVRSAALSGMDSLLSIVQMPRGVPVATVAIGNATNAAHLALRMLATTRPELRSALAAYRWVRAEAVHEDDRKTRTAQS